MMRSSRVRKILFGCLIGCTVLALAGYAQQPEKLRVGLGKSLVVNTPERLTRVAISQPEVATALLINERQVLIHGLRMGSVSLVFWGEGDVPQTFELDVVLELNKIRETLASVFPDQSIQLTPTGSSLVMRGVVSSQAVADQMEAVLKTQVPGVVNLLEVPENRDTVLLQVKFAEVNRRQLQELGVNIFSTGAANTPGIISTQQFSPVTGRVQLDGQIGAPIEGTTTEFELTDLLNIFIFRPDLNLGATIRALQQRSLLEILAEPNVLTMNGREASFLAGGEFPFPVVQGGTNFAVTIQFREFGVRLSFTPTIVDDDTIRLKVAPEVSALDFANAVTLSGFLIPALTTRRAESEVELKNGQSFAIAGLLDNRTIEVASKVPVLGDIPLLGKLFQSRSMDRTNTELMVMVTPHLVRPLNPDEVPEGPVFPKPFLDNEKFDKKYEKENKKQEEKPAGGD